MLSQICTIYHLKLIKFHLRFNLFVKDLDIYWLFNFNHMAAVSSSMTSFISSFARRIRIVLTAFISSSSYSSSVIFSCFFVFPYKAFTKPCYSNISFTLLFYNPKLPVSLNLTMFTLAIEALSSIGSINLEF